MTGIIFVSLLGFAICTSGCMGAGADEKKAERAEAVVVEKTIVAEKPPTAIAQARILPPPPPNAYLEDLPKEDEMRHHEEGNWDPKKYVLEDLPKPEKYVSDLPTHSGVVYIDPDRDGPSISSFQGMRDSNKSPTELREEIDRLGPSDAWGQTYAAVVEPVCKKEIERLNSDSPSNKYFEWLKRPDGSLFTAEPVEESVSVRYRGRLKWERWRNNQVVYDEGSVWCQYDIRAGMMSNFKAY